MLYGVNVILHTAMYVLYSVHLELQLMISFFINECVDDFFSQLVDNFLKIIVRNDNYIFQELKLTSLV